MQATAIRPIRLRSRSGRSKAGRHSPASKCSGHVAGIQSVWERAHIAVLPSRREGLPKSLLEAAAFGRPIVATDVPGCREIARHDVNAFLVPPDDPVALADAITVLARDPALRMKLGAAGRRLVEEEFSSTRIGQEDRRPLRWPLGSQTGPIADYGGGRLKKRAFQSGPGGTHVAHGRKIAVIGLGYVGLPVAVSFARSGVPVRGLRHRRATGSRNCAPARTARVRSNLPSFVHKRTDASKVIPRRSKARDFFIVTVPTPIDGANRPDLRALIGASETVGKAMSRGAIVVYESTVYPGCIEEDCVPVLEQRVGPEGGRRFHGRLFARAHQSRRQEASIRNHHQGGRRTGCKRRSISSPTSMVRW